jgi:hypothetical protein
MAVNRHRARFIQAARKGRPKTKTAFNQKNWLTEILFSY